MGFLLFDQYTYLHFCNGSIAFILDVHYIYGSYYIPYLKLLKIINMVLNY